jgi:hypothetical protein
MTRFPLSDVKAGRSRGNGPRSGGPLMASCCEDFSLPVGFD